MHVKPYVAVYLFCRPSELFDQVSFRPRIVFEVDSVRLHLQSPLVHNACSMRAYGMKPKAQCSRRRRACTCYASMRHAAKFQTDTASIASKTKAPVMKSGSLTGI